jgi:hypothetical protein
MAFWKLDACMSKGRFERTFGALWSASGWSESDTPVHPLEILMPAWLKAASCFVGMLKCAQAMITIHPKGRELKKCRVLL